MKVDFLVIASWPIPVKTLEVHYIRKHKETDKWITIANLF